MGWFKSSGNSQATISSGVQDGWFKRKLKKLASRFGNKSAEPVTEQVKPRLESGHRYDAAGLEKRTASNQGIKKRGSFFTRNKLKKLAASKNPDQQKVNDVLLADARRGGPDMLKMLNSDINSLARLLSLMSVDQQNQCLSTFFDCGEGVRTPKEARLTVHLVEEMAFLKGKSSDSGYINEFLLKLTGSRFRPHILVAMLDEGGKCNLVSYETLLHFSRHHYLQEAMVIADRMETEESLQLGVPSEIGQQLLSGKKCLGNPESAQVSELVAYSVTGRLLHAAQEADASLGVQTLLLMSDHLAFRELVAYNQKYGNGKELLGIDDKDFCKELESVRPARLEAIVETRGRDVPALLSEYGWKELPPDYPRTRENAPGDFLGCYMRTFVGRPPKPLRAHERKALERGKPLPHLRRG